MVFRQLRKVVLRLDGRGVGLIVGGADELDEGAFDARAIVLLYPSSERANDDAR